MHLNDYIKLYKYSSKKVHNCEDYFSFYKVVFSYARALSKKVVCGIPHCLAVSDTDTLAYPNMLFSMLFVPPFVENS